MHLTKLTSTTRLLLVAIVGLSHLRNRLTIGDLRRDVLEIDLVLRSDARAQDIQVVLTLTLNDGLLELLRVVYQDRGILVLGIVENLTQLLLVALLLALNGSTVARLGEGDRLDRHHIGSSREGIVGLRALELHGATDVTSRELGYLHTVLTSYGEELRDLLLVLRAGIHHLATLGQLTADHTEIGDLANVLLNLALEDECHGGSRLVGYDLGTLGREECGSLQRARSDIDDELHQTLRTDVALTAGAEDRHHLAVGHTNLQTGADIVLRQSALLEVELHEGLIVLGGHLDQLAVQLLRLLQLLGGNLELLAVTVVVLEAVHLHEQHIDEGTELGTLVYGILYDDGLHARSGLDRLIGSLERRLVAIELVDDTNNGLVELAGITSLNLATYLPAVGGVEYEYADITHLEGREERTAEVVRTRAVDDVELALHEFGEENRRIDRAFVLVLDIRIVRDRVIRLDTTPAIDHFPFVSHRLGKGSFSRAGSTNKNDVLNLFC